jgi:hypothetical protein
MISVRLAEEYGVEVPECGVEVGFDPAALCEQVYVGPSLTPDERRAVLDACKAAGLEDRFRVSTLLKVDCSASGAVMRKSKLAKPRSSRSSPTSGSGSTTGSGPTIASGGCRH